MKTSLGCSHRRTESPSQIVTPPANTDTDSDEKPLCLEHSFYDFPKNHKDVSRRLTQKNRVFQPDFSRAVVSPNSQSSFHSSPVVQVASSKDKEHTLSREKTSPNAPR